MVSCTVGMFSMWSRKRKEVMVGSDVCYVYDWLPELNGSKLYIMYSIRTITVSGWLGYCRRILVIVVCGLLCIISLK